MKLETSCGAVIYRSNGNNTMYLLLKHLRSGHWSFAKGHIDPGETEVETAEREILEETGLAITVDTAFRCEIKYSPKKDVMKDVIYFVAASPTAKITCPPDEIEGFLWLPLEEASKQLTYQECRDVLKQANLYIKKDNNDRI